jgi:hypothetical protein
VGLVAIACFIAGWPIYNKLSLRPVGTRVMERTRKAVEQNPQLQPDWDRAMADGVLTWPEARAILEKAGQKAEPETEPDE